MTGFTQLFGDWHLYILLLVFYSVSAAVSAMPMPDSKSSALYGWFFKFANLLWANVSRAAAGKIPGTTDIMPLPGAQDAVNQAAVVAKAAEIAGAPAAPVTVTVPPANPTVPAK